MATKTVTLVPPADHTQVEQILLSYNPDSGKVNVTIFASATDAATGAKDTATVNLQVLPTNPTVQNVYTAAINAWKTAKGY